jgi:hypothetical protein
MSRHDLKREPMAFVEDIRSEVAHAKERLEELAKQSIEALRIQEAFWRRAAGDSDTAAALLLQFDHVFRGTVPIRQRGPNSVQLMAYGMGEVFQFNAREPGDYEAIVLLRRKQR